jgi:WD40 repeat protein
MSTPTVTSTPGPLKPAGPYLFTGYRLVNPDGSGGRDLPWMDDWNPLFVSPNGEWSLQYSDDQFGDGQSEILSLSLIHVPDGKVVPLIDVATRSLLESHYGFLTGECGGHYYYQLYDHAWSPDGRYLAFTANISGQGLDLFSYDTDRINLRRLTNEAAEVLSIAWSPDSRTVYYISGYQMTPDFTFASFTLSAAYPEYSPGTETRLLFSTTKEIAFYAMGGEDTLLVNTYPNQWCMAGGSPDSEGAIVSINADSQTAKEIPLLSSAQIRDVDPTTDRMIVEVPPDSPNGSAAYAVYSFDGEIHAALGAETDDCGSLLFLGENRDSFLCKSRYGGLSVIAEGGEARRINSGGMSNYSIRSSPDRMYFLLYAEWDARLYSAGGDLIAERSFEAPEDGRYYSLVTGIVWRPDGVYVTLGNRRIEHFSFADSAVTTVYACPDGGICVWGLTWADWK